jgi:hypothetical protein
MNRNRPKTTGIVQLVIDREHGALINPLREGESDDFDDVTNAVFYGLENIDFLSKTSTEVASLIRDAVEEGGYLFPDWLENDPAEDDTWMDQAKRWLNSKVGESEIMWLAENTPFPEYRDGVELRSALEAAQIQLPGLREVCLRGAPGGSLFVTAYSGDPTELNRLLVETDLPYRVTAQQPSTTNLVPDQWSRITRSNSKR